MVLLHNISQDLTIYANSTGLSGSFPDTGWISHYSQSPVRATESPKYKGKCFHTYFDEFWPISRDKI